MKWEFHPEAEAELIESAAYYEGEVPGLGRRFGRAVSEALELLSENPEIGSLVDSELRSFIVGSFPYSNIYAPYKDLLFVLAVAHARRKPGYWKSRHFR
jgi:plasmid stabilization system protein ParE